MPTRRSLAGALAAGALLATPAAAQAPEQGEPTIDRIRRTKTLRIAVLPGEAPFFIKDPVSGTWSGTAIAMAQDIAKVMQVDLAYVESTYPNSVLDLQANKVDLAFALNPTPARALAIGFTRPYYMHPFGYVARNGFRANGWADLDRPERRVATLLGALGDVFTTRYAPKAQMTAYKTGNEAILAVQSGRADCVIYGIIQALGVRIKNPNFDSVGILHDPLIALPSCMGVRQEADMRWRDFLDEWVDYNRGTRQISVWFLDGLAKGGVKAEDVPPDSGF
jgi:polar amino acid transport system substrate-binding protein